MTQTELKDRSGIIRWLPSLIAVLGIVFSIFSWHLLRHKSISEHYLDSLGTNFPWIILVSGLIASFFLAYIARLLYLIEVRKHSIDKMNEDVKKEVLDRIHAEETKQKLEKALLQGQKLQAIGTLAGGIAHDFNNLLYAIIGYVEMAQEDIAKDSLTYSNLGKVLAAAHRGRELIARILAFSRRQHHDFQSICLKDTIEGILGLLKPTIPASVTISFIVHTGEHCYIQGNQTQLHQVIVNIINNAVDAMDGEGTVTITLDLIRKNDSELEEFPKISNNSNYYKITISDTGHGMDQSTIERIFEPFFTTKEVGKGTGLGLSTVHAIIEEHKGEIEVTSQLGHGTTFTMLLPEHINMENQNGENTIS